MKGILLVFMLFCSVCYGAESVSVAPVKSELLQHLENGAIGTIHVTNSSAQTKLADGDVVEWVYKENRFYKPNHVTLGEWVKGLELKKS